MTSGRVARGQAYHYSGCGCGGRQWSGDEVDWIWTKAATKLDVVDSSRLRISYFIPHHNDVLIIGYAACCLALACGKELNAPRYFTQLLEFKDVTAPPGPIIYWDQGHEHVFGDPTGSLEWDRVFHMAMHLPIAYISVSSVIRDILWKHFKRRAPIVPNAIDCTVFRPDPNRKWPSQSPARASTAVRRVLLVGNPGLQLKNFQTALQALNNVHQRFRSLQVTWVCQIQPTLGGITFPVEYIVNPPQEDLPGIYRNDHDVLLFASVYEGWGMPVLEAMAAGVPVVTSRCHGVDMFCTDEENCLMAEPYDVQGLASAVERLLGDPALSEQFALRGRRVAEGLTWDRSISELEWALRRVARCLGKRPSISREAVLMAQVVEQEAPREPGVHSAETGDGSADAVGPDPGLPMDPVYGAGQGALILTPSQAHRSHTNQHDDTAGPTQESIERAVAIAMQRPLPPMAAHFPVHPIIPGVPLIDRGAPTHTVTTVTTKRHEEDLVSSLASHGLSQYGGGYGHSFGGTATYPGGTHGNGYGGGMLGRRGLSTGSGGYDTSRLMAGIGPFDMRTSMMRVHGTSSLTMGVEVPASSRVGLLHPHYVNPRSLAQSGTQQQALAYGQAGLGMPVSHASMGMGMGMGMGCMGMGMGTMAPGMQMPARPSLVMGGSQAGFASHHSQGSMWPATHQAAAASFGGAFPDTTGSVGYTGAPGEWPAQGSGGYASGNMASAGSDAMGSFEHSHYPALHHGQPTVPANSWFSGSMPMGAPADYQSASDPFHGRSFGQATSNTFSHENSHAGAFASAGFTDHYNGHAGISHGFMQGHPQQAHGTMQPLPPADTRVLPMSPAFTSPPAQGMSGAFSGAPEVRQLQLSPAHTPPGSNSSPGVLSHAISDGLQLRGGHNHATAAFESSEMASRTAAGGADCPAQDRSRRHRLRAGPLGNRARAKGERTQKPTSSDQHRM